MADSVGIIHDQVDDQIMLDQSIQTAQNDYQWMEGNKIQRAAFRAFQKPVWDFEHHDGGRVVKPRTTTYLNGVRQGRRPLFHFIPQINRYR